MESLARCMKLEKPAFHDYLYSRREEEVRRKEGGQDKMIEVKQAAFGRERPIGFGRSLQTENELERVASLTPR